MTKDIEIKLADVQRRYPHPIAPPESYDPGTYCVGGALCLYMAEVSGDEGAVNSFPPRAELRDALLAANPELSIGQAWFFADQIATSNDGFQFEQAWHMLGNALRATA